MKIQLMRLIRLKNFVLLFLVSTSFLYHPVKLFAQDLKQIESEEGKKKVYYGVGDQYLTKGLDLIDRYWSEVAQTGKHLLRGHLDNYLPIALKSLNHEPATKFLFNSSLLGYGSCDRNFDIGNSLQLCLFSFVARN